MTDGIIKLSTDPDANPYKAFAISSLNYDLCRGFDVRRKLCSPHDFQTMTRLDKNEVRKTSNTAALYMQKINIGS